MPKRSISESWTDYAEIEQYSSREYPVISDSRDNPERPKAPTLSRKNSEGALRKSSEKALHSVIRNSNGQSDSYSSYTDGKKSSSISAPPNSPHEYSGRI
jgi:hypothetical protein